MVFDLEKEALIASGIQGNDLMGACCERLDGLYREFRRQIRLPNDVSSRSKALFDWLWRQKPNRYGLGSDFRLNHVIEAQTDQGTQVVGNCLGLTLLYNCLLRRLGIYAGALNLENAFGKGPHVLTALKIDEDLVDVENILPHGFDYHGHINNPSRASWGDKELVADIYLSMGNLLFDKGRFDEALENYDRAVDLNSEYEKARINRAICLMELENRGEVR